MISAASGSLHELQAGDTVTFAGQTWILLNPSTGYLVMQGPYCSDRAFDTNGNSVFTPNDPNDDTNIGWFLNHDPAGFYQNLSLENQTLIQTHRWTIGNEANESASSVDAKIGLLSLSECNEYGDYLGSVSDNSFTRTALSVGTNFVWIFYQVGSLPTNILYSDYPFAVRPALYLNPEILVLNGQVTAQYSPNNPGNGGESSGNTPPAGTNTKTEISGNTVTVTTTIAADDGTGKATASVSQTQVKDMIGKAAEEAKKQGNTTAVIVEIKIEAAADTKTVQTALPKPAVNALAADSNIDALRVSTQIAAITFDRKALDTIAGATTDDVKISATKIDTSTLTDETKLKVGDGPVFNFSVTSGNRTISEFAGTYRYRFHITPKAGEDTNAIVIY